MLFKGHRLGGDRDSPCLPVESITWLPYHAQVWNTRAHHLWLHLLWFSLTALADSKVRSQVMWKWLTFHASPLWLKSMKPPCLHSCPLEEYPEECTAMPKMDKAFNFPLVSSLASSICYPVKPGLNRGVHFKNNLEFQSCDYNWDCPGLNALNLHIWRTDLTGEDLWHLRCGPNEPRYFEMVPGDGVGYRAQ